MQSAFIENISVNLIQPDGSYLNCFASGDEYYVRLHDKENYTISQNILDGYYYYAISVNNNIVTSQYRADKPIPKKSSLKPNLYINKEDYINLKNLKNNRRGRDAPTSGIINNINIFIRFADEAEFGTPRYIMDEPFNKEEGPSLQHYFNEVSYSQVEVITHHFPICDMSTNLSYQDEYPRSYYQPYNAQTNPNGYTSENSAIREQTMLKNAIEFINNEVSLDLDVDGDNDGYVDNVTFLISGSPDGWSDLLWPHRWSLYLYTVFINGAIVDAYNLNLATGGYFTVGTLCHEFFHSMGAPDLYHYNETGAPVSAGGWDIMDGSSDIPQYMSSWLKHKYGNWIDCPIIEQLGIYPLLPLQNQENSCYRINSPNSNNEFFILEYRNKEGIYEINTPGDYSGMLIYRINGNLNGNANGPPDEVYLYREGGTTTDNGNLTQAIFSLETERTEFNDSTNPSSFLYGGSPGGLNIQDIGYPGDIIEFTFWNIFIQTNIVDLYSDDDNDGILNPGESAYLTLSANILSAPSEAENVTGYLSSDLNWIQFNPSEITFENLPNNGNPIEVQTQIILDDIELLSSAKFNLEINADFNDNGAIINYNDDFNYEIDITLNQVGFPISTSEIRSNPIIIDIDNDGNNEIVVGDYSGLIRIYNIDGSEFINDIFPFDTGNNIWGSIASADINSDGIIEFVVASKSKNLYIFNYEEVILEFETDYYLIGTPTIGNLDNDSDLEIVFSGYSSNNKLFAINMDGSNVNGFPFNIEEKTKSGSALADFNNNGKDDIVIGTDNNNLYLIHDDGLVAPGFPFSVNDKFQSAPSILNINGQKMIYIGNNDNKLYVIDGDGNLKFSILTEDKINTSPAFLNINDNIYAFFGSKDDHIYAIDSNGIQLENWPILLDGNVEGEVVFSDLNGSGYSEVIAATDAGSIYILNIDGSQYQYSPISNNLPFTGPSLIKDIDNDGDAEIITGSINSLSILDIKNPNNFISEWSMFRGNLSRSGYYNSNVDCVVELGDANGDTLINILDLVQIANYILNYSTPEYECACDLNTDGQVNIFDLVITTNLILEN